MAWLEYVEENDVAAQWEFTDHQHPCQRTHDGGPRRENGRPGSTSQDHSYPGVRSRLTLIGGWRYGLAHHRHPVHQGASGLNWEISHE